LQAIQGLKVRDLIDPASKAGAALTPETLDKNALQYYDELQQKAAAAATEVERLRTA
jgi:hypothetical protein